MATATAGRRCSSNGAVMVACVVACLAGTAWAWKPKPAAVEGAYMPKPAAVKGAYMPKPAAAAAGMPAGALDITKLGAKGDGKSDSTQAIQQAWSNACGATGTHRILIPPGNFLTGGLELKGPCTSSIIIRLDGNLLGTGDLSAYKKNWIEIMHVDNFSINGHGTIDGQGPLVWDKNECDKKYNCKVLPNSLVLDYLTNAMVRGVTLKNAKFFHLNIYNCKNVLVEKVTITAPGDSPNTDGIHMGDSQNVTIRETTIGVGDDCISIGPGCSHIKVHNSRCGPGHGISVGSLGRYADEKNVEDIKVTNCTLTGTTNGLRIKSYEDSKSQLTVSNFLYDGIIMNNVSFPIIINQKYCPHNICSKSSGSKIKVNDIVFKNIAGTSKTPEVVTFNCDSHLRCEGVKLDNIHITYTGTDNTTMSVCNNAVGTSVNVAKELSCLSA